MKDLVIIIVNYNAEALLHEALRSVFASAASIRFGVIVVDNASSDGSTDMVRTQFPEVRVICNAENVGFARANNQGIEAESASVYFLLNSDVTLPPDAIQRLWDYVTDHPQVGVAAPLLRYPDGRPQNTARRFPTPANAIFGRRSLLTRLFPGNRFSRRYIIEPPADGGPYAVDWVSGAAFMVKRDVIEDVGLLDEGYFIYWEDADWCHRIRSREWEIHSVPEVEVVHHEGGSSRTQSSRMILEFHRSITRFYLTHYLRTRWHPLYIPAWLMLRLRAYLLIVANVVLVRACTASGMSSKE